MSNNPGKQNFAILLIGWVLGFFVFSLGSVIHFLLVFAIIAVLFRLIRGRGV
ncbi:MAG TPA: lmo0937 family membrane protein [Cyclobacteriaceae bacterium]|nr:lmo0937 family membrane protein [Cyclobacteriaceae bacterium]